MFLSVIPVCAFFGFSLCKLVDDIVELLDELKFEAEDILLLPDTWQFHKCLSVALIKSHLSDLELQFKL